MNVNEKPRSNGLWRICRRWLLILGVMYIGFVGLVAVNENYLVYPGSGVGRGNWEPDFEFEEVEFESADGTKLVGWYLPYPGSTETALVCHGNGENVAQSSHHTGVQFQAALNANVFVFDYRGYGKSEGSPHQAGVLQDAGAAMAYLNKRTGTEPVDVILVGHSIGGGPAVHLASTVGAKALFLQRTFSSLVEPAKRQFWFLPVDLIMQNRFPNGEWIKECHVPLHQSHGDQDTLVPFDSGRQVFDNSPAELKEFWVNKDRGHWDRLPMDYWNSVTQFLEQINETSSTVPASTSAEPVDSAGSEIEPPVQQE